MEPQPDTNMDLLPVLISIPHGGDQIPPEVEDRICLTSPDIFYDGDSLTKDIFGFKNQVAALLDTPIARAVVDLNRKAADRPLNYSDGVVNAISLKGTAVYHCNRFPDEELIQALLDRYYHPYHQQLDELVNKPGIRIALDCHSMLPYSPPFSNSRRHRRPLICLSNGGDNLGCPLKNGKQTTCSPDTIQQLAECFRVSFEIPDSEVTINDPFSGGYIIQSHFKGNIPWIQVEINKSLYLTMPTKKQPSSIAYSAKKIDRVKEKVWMAFKLFFLNF